METIHLGALLGMVIKAETRWADYTQEQKDALAKRMISDALSAGWPEPVHLRLLIEGFDTAKDCYWQSWVAMSSAEVRFNGTDEPAPLFFV